VPSPSDPLETTDRAASVPRETLRNVFRHRPDPYGGSDPELARRICAGVWALNGLLVLALLPLAPPIHELGRVGLGLAALIVVLSLVEADSLFHRDNVSMNELLAKSYLGIAQVTLLNWLAGGGQAPYNELFLLWVVFTAAAHPPRRTAAFLVGVAVAASAFLLYDGWHPVAAAALAIQLVLWSALAVTVSLWALNTRAHRVRLQREKRHATQLARVDALTGLGNRRSFDEALEVEVARAQRTGAALSVLVADLDGFKEINDLYGHLNGDQCLRQVAGAISGAVRTPDGCYRWGGDEFAVLLPEADETGAQIVCDRLREHVSQNCTRPDGAALAIGCGHAQLRAGMGPDDLMAAADMALIELKSRSGSGRGTEPLRERSAQAG
jgi:diguanylate cyclase (GGDEF)-like protein